jgi:hypothetical protein
MVSLNNLTDQSQFLTTGTAGTNFAIASSGDTHTFNLPVASATNTGKLSSTDWSTFNNKQNLITNPITGTGASGNVAYFDSTTSITAENSFNYDASLNRLGVNTTVPNATIGANAGIDSGYSLLLKNDNANYNGIGFATSSTYGNVIGTEKLGTALARNLTLLNQSGYISLTEAGSLGVNILNPNAGVDIYSSTSSSLCLHTANSGVTSTDGLRLSLFSNSNGVLRNNEGSLSMSSEGDFYLVTLGAENIRVNSANGFVGIGNPTTLTSLLTVNGAITQSSVLSSLLKTNASGTLVAAVAGTDYVVPSALSGYVPTSRTITINGTTQNLSTDISYSVGTIGGSGDSGRVAYYNGTNSITSEAGFIYDSSTNRLGVNTSVPNATIGADAALNSGYGLLIKTGASNYNGIGIAIDSTYGNTIETAKLGTAPARNLTLLNQGGFISVTENGNLGVNILTANTGIDIYNSTQSQLWLHNAATGITATDGVRLALFNNKSANLINFDGGLSLTAEGDFQIITIGAENFRINSANGFVGIGNPATLTSIFTVNGSITQSVTSALLKTNASGTIIAAVAGTDYVLPSALSGYLPLSGGTLTGTLNGINSNFSGNVGIGTTSPDTKLDVRGEISLAYSSDNGLRFWNQDRSNWSSISNTITAPSSSANLIFRTSAGVALTIDPNRNATFTTNITAQQGTFSSSVTAASLTANGLIYGRANASFPASGLGYYALKTNNFDGERGGLTIQVSSSTNTLTDALTINYLGAATFSSSVTATSSSFPLDVYGTTNNYGLRINNVQASTLFLYSSNANSANRNWGLFTNSEVFGDFDIRQSNAINGDMTAGANSTSRLYIRNDGAAKFSSGISIGGATATTGGIQFPTTEVNINNPNNLDDYEEGSFTPVVLGNSTPGTASYSAQNGRYVKIGRAVNFNLYCDWNGGNGTGSLLIGGLPYVADAVGIYPACAIGETSGISLAATGIMTARVQISDNKIFIQQYPLGGGSASSVSYDGTGYVVLAGTYYV